MMNYNELVAMLMALADNDGKTFKAGKPVAYKSGWQVATHGYETADAKVAAVFIQTMGDCGVWLSNGIYYIDSSKRVNTKREAVAIGIQHNQQSVLCWRNMKLIWLA